MNEGRYDILKAGGLEIGGKHLILLYIGNYLATILRQCGSTGFAYHTSSILSGNHRVISEIFSYYSFVQTLFNYKTED